MSERQVSSVAVIAFVAGLAIGSVATFMAVGGNSPAQSAVAVNPGAPPADAAGPAATGVIINDRELTQQQVTGLTQMYGAAPPAGRYWYDSRSGLYGYAGREAAGYIRTGHDFGPLAADASRGNTGSFINGREINAVEAAFFQRLFGVVYQGRFWLDGNTGALGIEGDPTPRASLVQALRQAQVGRGEYHWRDGSGGVVGGEGNCTFAAIPGAPVYSTPGCG